MLHGQLDSTSQSLNAAQLLVSHTCGDGLVQSHTIATPLHRIRHCTYGRTVHIYTVSLHCNIAQASLRTIERLYISYPLQPTMIGLLIGKVRSFRNTGVYPIGCPLPRSINRPPSRVSTGTAEGVCIHLVPHHWYEPRSTYFWKIIQSRCRPRRTSGFLLTYTLHTTHQAQR